MTETDSQKFNWFAEWYPVMSVCDLDKRIPHAKTVMGLDFVAWWERITNAWKVIGDSWPHRLAPPSKGRINQSGGRLQCVYRGLCYPSRRLR
ncbi:unnamed protein product [Linum trigynum]|uniref:Rieske domain-containing protein n=1 Tax=Linum trigynum TaxID=586398 RepID=A0AAV2DIC7_9ROSI